MIEAEPAARPSEARDRLLGTAMRLFYGEGIHAVGVDRIVAEAKVTRATFYRHFPSKEDLVVAYLQSVHGMFRGQVDTVLAGGRPAAGILRDVARGIAQELRMPGFRGCAFINAAAEYPDAGNPVRQAVLAHREWFRSTITTLFTQAGDTAATVAGRQFVMLRDGAQSAGCMDDPVLAGETFLTGVESLLRTLPPER